MKKYSALIFISALISLLCFISFAHGGRTDSNGGHYDRSTGEYHYHHGYSAHDHYDMDGDGDIDCPYKFDDKTNHNSNGGNSSSQDRLDNLFNGSTTDTATDKTTEASDTQTPNDKSDPQFLTWFMSGIGLFGFIFCIFWIKNAYSQKDMFYAVFSMIGNIVVFVLGLCALIFL